MTPLIGVYLFLLGFASGLALLAAASFRHVSPRWLQWLLTATACLVISRYVTMALFTAPEAFRRFWPLRWLWFTGPVALTLPGVFAMDQLLQHPAMSPKTILRWYAPFLAVYAVVLIFGVGPTAEVPEAWNTSVSPVWRMILSTAHGIFTLAFLAACVVLVRKPLAGRARLALLGLAAAYLYLAFDGVLLAFNGWYFRPFLFSEMVALVAIWNAFDTAASLRINR